MLKNTSKLGEEVYLDEEDILQLCLSKDRWIVYVTDYEPFYNMYRMLYNNTNLFRERRPPGLPLIDNEAFRLGLVVASPIVDIYYMLIDGDGQSLQDRPTFWLSRNDTYWFTQV